MAPKRNIERIKKRLASALLIGFGALCLHAGEQTTISKLNDRITEMNLQLSDLTTRLETQGKEFHVTSDQLRAKNDEQARDLGTLRAANAALAAEKDELMRASQKLREKSDELIKQLDAQKAQVASVEKKLSERGASPADSNIEEMEALWQQAKSGEDRP